MGFVVSLRWAREEFKNAEVWDKRCIPSLITMAKAVYKDQTRSFSAACGPILRQNGSRIFSNKKMNPEKMQAGHYEETAKRAKHESIVLCVQDTTSFNYSGHKGSSGLGHIGTDPKSKGIHAHTVLALRRDGLPLGIIGQKQWVRKEEDRGKRHKRKLLPIEDKESYKWIEGLHWVEQRLSKKIEDIWIISDRESDIYEYMNTDRSKNIHLLLRATQARIIEAEIDGSTKRGRLTELIESLPKVATKDIEITRENKTLKLSLSISYHNIRMYPPVSGPKESKPLEMTVIYAQELESKDKAEGIEWVLLSDKQNLSIEEAITMLDYYSQRWKVERFHFTLKTGVFNVEKLQFDDAETLMNAISFYSIVSWQVLWLLYFSRLEPGSAMSSVIGTTEQEVLEAYSGKKIKTVLEAVMAIAMLGGFLGGSKRYPYPGIKVIWAGIIKLAAMKEGWLLAKSHFLKNYAT